ncbi:hypothetical protein, partial [Corynebacterium belfantii]|uniref:hypothetical protein n=1 Tax=Corynebacterium belfantii TaxID=2014537 RepID=UPI001BDFBD91
MNFLSVQCSKAALLPKEDSPPRTAPTNALVAPRGSSTQCERRPAKVNLCLPNGKTALNCIMNCSPLVGLRNQFPTNGEYFFESTKFSKP